MTSLLYINQWEASHLYTSIRREISQHELLQMSLKVVDSLSAMLNENEACISSGYKTGMATIVNSSYQDIARLFVRPNDRFGLCRIGGQLTSSIQRAQAEEFTNSLVYAIDNQLTFIERVQRGKDLNSAVFIDRADTMMSAAKLMIGLQCSDCGEIVATGRYEKHRQTERCMIDTVNRDVRSANFSRIVDREALAAIKKSKIGYEMRPAAYDVWVPFWVTEAIEAYKRNDGFAGMPLAEYLTRMNPDRES